MCLAIPGRIVEVGDGANSFARIDADGQSPRPRDRVLPAVGYGTCSILLDSGAADGGHYRLVPDRRLRLEGFDLEEIERSARC